ncbi:T9SS C-terminal target domain-containing protein [Lacinutrix jangbogonensis]|uniref:T9SS C-terminal target domain-containing protein n=1 Tax=Lacinutrix jangbogonensis TaxID=1469557 RepID=UPI00053E6369|nr:T9SS C-terminal target domain-containing protein [Lacinutrix jangbogonensis]
MPNNSSVEVLVTVGAPISPGGIATSVTILSPNGTTDSNTANNQSIISIDVTDLPIDFSVVYSQVAPLEGTGINNWDDTVTYQFTITNNSSIPFPLDGFSGRILLANASNLGVPLVQFQSIICSNGTNGTLCPDVSGVPQMTSNAGASPFFSYNNPILFNANSTLSFEIVYQYLEPTCSIELGPLAADSFIRIELDHANESSNDSNVVFTQLVDAPLCFTTDLCIETTQINPLPSQMVNWDQEVTFETIVCNNGPLDAFGRFFLQNLSINIEWDIVSITCDTTTGNITCNDFTLTDQDTFWLSNNFNIPANVTITITTIAKFIDPDDCSPGTPNNSTGHVRSGINLLEPNILDSNMANNAESDFVILPALPTCEPEDLVDLQITKTQIDPILPLGSDDLNTISWGNITYEITATNPNQNLDALIEIQDYMPNGANVLTSATLISVHCISTTGTAICPTINTTNIGVILDGVPDAGIEDIFWSITPEDSYTLPAQSSITFQVVVNWQPECSSDAIEATNAVKIISSDGLADNAQGNNQASVITFFAPCVDLVVQTYPEFTQVIVNQSFNWIIDITNSNTSSNAINIDFQDIIGNQFTLNGVPTCTVVNGNASCTSFTINGNTIIGVIPNMDAASTLQIVIPVTAPSYGGAFTNNAQAIPNESDNQELSIETNISISNVQVIAPNVLKSFTPNQIIAGQESVLEFTVTNLAGNPAQNNIDFTDNLPTGLSVSGPISWTQSNGCTATFTGNNGDTSVIVNNLMFPINVSTCTFAVPVTATSIGDYLNNDSNFSDQNNIDTSLANATLEVIVDNTNVDIEVLKSVSPTQAFVGENVAFTITVSNLGTDEATNITILETLPTGYQFISASTSLGNYDDTLSLWSLNSLLPNQTETLSITAQVISSNNLINSVSLNGVTQTDRDVTNNQDTAEVTILIPDVDIEVLKSVSPIETSLGESVTFSITVTNLGTTNGSNIFIYESLPSGYIYSSANTTYGIYNDSTFLWNLPNLSPNQSETLTITAQVISSNNLLNTASLDSVEEIDQDDTNNEDSAEVSVNDCLKITQGISPNNDGDNDTFTINCVEDYPVNSVNIFNRYGTLVFEANNYKNNWNGIPNKGTPKSNALLPVGTYYYVITIESIEKPFAGWIYLNY